MRFAIIVDSGAAESVAPESTCPHLPLMKSPGSRAGLECRTAGGERLKNNGQRQVQAWTEEGCPVGMTFQVAKVTKPLNSASKMCDAGNVVIFTAHGGTMLNLWTCTTTRIGRESGVCVLNTWVRRGNTR